VKSCFVEFGGCDFEHFWTMEARHGHRDRQENYSWLRGLSLNNGNPGGHLQVWRIFSEDAVKNNHQSHESEQAEQHSIARQ